MSHYKSESGGNLPKALCRFVKILPTGPYVTFGSGCIVLQSGPPPSADLITTTQVLTKNDLLGDSSIFVQFEDNQWFELKLKSQDAANLPDSKPGRVLREIKDNEDQVSFLRIPVDMFDSRMWLARKISPVKKRALSCFYPSDENLETSISNKNITCYVISEDRMNKRFYITEPSYLCFGKDTHEFALLSVTDTDCASPAKTFKDFAKEEKPKGAPLLDAKGRLVGMLAVAKSGERKVFPVFLPTLTGDSNTDGPGDEKKSNTDTVPVQNTIFRPGPDKKEQHNDHSSINPPSKDFRNEYKGAQTSTTDRQGSESREKDPQVDNCANEDVAQNLGTQARIPTLATQNSCHDQFSNPDCLHDDEDTPFPKTVTDPTPSKHKPTLRERDSNSQHGMDVVAPMQTGGVSTEKEHVYAGSFLKDKIVSKEDIMDVLILHLDRSVCLAPGVPAIQRWEHLADQFKVPDDVKSQCANFSGKLSSSESLFEHLRVTKDSLTVKKVKSYLKKLERNDVVAELEKNSHLKDESTVTDLYEKHSETLCSICMKLDDKRSIRNWYHFGIEIGIEAGTLRRLRDPSRDSPSEMVLKIIKTRKPRHPLKTLAADISLPGVTEALAGFPDNSTIETLLGNMDAMQNVTALLDLNRKWKNVGQHYHIDQRILDNLEPSDFQSPTKTVLEYIVNREPTETMDTFLRFLQNIDRSDVIDDLKEFFYADDIEKILRAGGPLPS